MIVWFRSCFQEGGITIFHREATEMVTLLKDLSLLHHFHFNEMSVVTLYL